MEKRGGAGSEFNPPRFSKERGPGGEFNPPRFSKERGPGGEFNPPRFSEERETERTIAADSPPRFSKERGPGGEFAFRLPSEAEWEYACCAGAETMFYFGDEVEQLAEYAWYEKNSNHQTHPVGQLQPNNFGLYDMLGNVWEWCQDAWHDSYEGAPADGCAWKEGGDINLRLLKGGSYFSGPVNTRCARRSRDRREDHNLTRGLRLACAAGGQ